MCQPTLMNHCRRPRLQLFSRNSFNHRKCGSTIGAQQSLEMLLHSDLILPFVLIKGKKRGGKKRRDKGRVNLCQLQQLSNENTKQDPLLVFYNTFWHLHLLYIFYFIFLSTIIKILTIQLLLSFHRQVPTPLFFFSLHHDLQFVSSFCVFFFFFNFICTKLTLKLSSL